MSFLGFILLGLICGAIAKAILPGRQGGGWIATLILGVVGALLGGWLGGLIFHVELQRLLLDPELDHRDRRLDHRPAHLGRHHAPQRQPRLSLGSLALEGASSLRWRRPFGVVGA